MTIYLINKETQEIIAEHSGVERWDYSFVECINYGRKAKFYCNTEVEYFTDKNPREVVDEQ